VVASGAMMRAAIKLSQIAVVPAVRSVPMRRKLLAIGPPPCWDP
jgi:hypothetical protein